MSQSFRCNFNIFVRDNKWKVTISLASQLENEEYRKECDSSYAFFKEKIIKLPKSAGAKRISKRELFKEYEVWCYRNGVKPLDIGMLGRKLTKQGFKGMASNGDTYWVDIELRK